MLFAYPSYLIPNTDLDRGQRTKEGKGLGELHMASRLALQKSRYLSSNPYPALNPLEPLPPPPPVHLHLEQMFLLRRRVEIVYNLIKDLDYCHWNWATVIILQYLSVETDHPQGCLI